MDPKTSLGRRGYIIHKKAEETYPIQFFEQIANELTVSTKPNDYSKPKVFKIYGITPKGDWILPRYYGLNKLGKPETDTYKLGKEIPNLKFKGKLRDSQIPAIKALIKAFNEIGGGILSVPCGAGKTVNAIYCIYKIKRKTIIIVNRLELIKQWVSEINQFLPNARVSVIDGENIDVQGSDVVIGMVNTLAMRDYPAQTFNSFDFLIVDECHTIATEIFSQCLPKIRTYYTLGLSATPERKDGLFPVVEYYLGPICYREDTKLNTNKDIIVNVIEYYKPGRKEIRNTINGKPNSARMINELASDPQRNEFIALVIYYIVKTQGKARQILLLSDRKAMLKNIRDELMKLGLKEEQANIFTADTKKDELDEVKKSQVILGVYAICGTGLNLPRLNTLILASPRTSIEQPIGRILRKEHPINPLVIDVADNYSIFGRQLNARKRYYIKNDNAIRLEFPKEIFKIVLE